MPSPSGSDDELYQESARLKSRKVSANLSWPPFLVIGLILLAGALLGGRYQLFPTSVVVAIFVVAFGLATYSFYEENRQRYDRAIIATGCLIVLVTLAEVGALVHLLGVAFNEGKGVSGPQLLASGLYFWSANILTFALWYWFIDRGGPDDRAQRLPGRPDFLFPEMTASETIKPNWQPDLTEYLYLSFTNATAFSPTDTLPLSSRARILMAIEALMSLVSLALVAARAINML